MSDITIRLQPKQKQFLEKVESTPITFYGGAKGGGKSKGVRDIMLLRRFKYPKTHGGLFRRTYKELEGNHIRPIFKEYPSLKEYWNESKKLLKLPNGSTIEFCHCEGERDVNLYQGREFEDLAIEEAGQWTESMFGTLLGSNRSSTPGFKPRALLTGNPGGIGHSWLKRLFIERRFKEIERPQDYAFVQALVTDNPALIENDPGYLHRLESEPNEVLRKAYRWGDWDIFAGQFFSELRREVHFIKSFPIPRHWTKFGSYDFGFNHPAAFGWFACDEDGNVHLYREFVKAQLRVDQFCQRINEFDDTRFLNPVIAGHDCWAQKRSLVVDQAAPTVAEEFSNHGIELMKAATDRIQGAANLRRYLAWQDLPSGRTEPKLFIHDTCPVTFECLTRMQHDPDRVEDVLKQDATDGDVLTGDDPYDMIRYGLMSRPLEAEKPKEQHAAGTTKWAHEQTIRMEESIDRQARHQEAQENDEIAMEIAGLDLDEDPLKVFINRRKGR